MEPRRSTGNVSFGWFSVLIPIISQLRYWKWQQSGLVTAPCLPPFSRPFFFFLPCGHKSQPPRLPRLPPKVQLLVSDEYTNTLHLPRRPVLLLSTLVALKSRSGRKVDGSLWSERFRSRQNKESAREKHTRPHTEPGLHPGEATQRKSPSVRPERRLCYSNMVSTWAKLSSHLFNTQTPHAAPRCHEAKGSHKHLMWGRPAGGSVERFQLSVRFIQWFPVKAGGWRFKSSPLRVFSCFKKELFDLFLPRAGVDHHWTPPPSENYRKLYFADFELVIIFNSFWA